MKVVSQATDLGRFHGSAFVPTMGALHEGHASLIRSAKDSGLDVVVSIFVNPKQFAPNEDLSRYPRTLDSDLELCSALGVAAVFTPEVDEIYPPDQLIEEISPGPLGSELEGASRPTHFQGVLTVVNRLFSLVRPKIAVFGKKDRQQLVLIQQMVRERDLGIEILEGPTVRDDDGLALSSRNRYLDSDARSRALALPRALEAVVETGSLEAARTELQGSDVDYLQLRDPLLRPITEDYSGSAVVLGAIRVDGVRLIDNMDLVLP